MPLDMDAMATEVVLIVKTSLGPVLERLSAAEARLSAIPSYEQTIADLRERVVVAETTAALVKAAVPVVEKSASVDLAPILERLAAGESRLDALDGVRDRVVSLETKAAEQKPEAPPPPPVDLNPVHEALAAVRADIAVSQQVAADIVGVRERVAVLETVVAQPTPALVAPPPPAVDLSPVNEALAVLRSDVAATQAAAQQAGQDVVAVRERVSSLETTVAQPAPEPAPVPPQVDLAPVLERVAVLEEQHKAAAVTGQVVAGLLERVVAVETKAPEALPPVDLAPIQAQLGALAGRVEALGDVRDRVIAWETKSAVVVHEAPPPVDLTPVYERLASTEVRLADVRERVLAVEEKSTQPVQVPAQAVPEPVNLTPLAERIAGLETEVRMKSAEVAPVAAAVAELTKETSALRERVAVAEVRPLLPGPAGKDGVNGVDGKDGAPGADGLGFDDLMVVQQDERSFTIKALRGDRAKDIGTVSFPVQIYRGVFTEGKSYEVGDVCTWGGSSWSCVSPTSAKPGEGSKGWLLSTKRGRDGRDGVDAPGALPIVKVGQK